jgi:hypothetical protein
MTKFPIVFGLQRPPRGPVRSSSPTKWNKLKNITEADIESTAADDPGRLVERFVELHDPRVLQFTCPAIVKS